MKISECRLGFIGFGHMAQVICRAIEQARLIPRHQIHFVRKDPTKAKQSEQEFKITATSLEHLVKQSDILLLAVRPNQTEPLLKEIEAIGLGLSKVLISVVSGFKHEFYQKHLGAGARVLRAMPNIASAVNEGMTLFNFGAHFPTESKSLAHILFSSMGEVMEIAEAEMDIGTAVAGCGPGFVFQLIESVARSAEKQGLEYEKALKMAAQAFVGAARLILKGNKPQILLQKIATPNGLTEAGLKKMRALDIDSQIHAVVESAANKSKEISG